MVKINTAVRKGTQSLVSVRRNRDGGDLNVRVPMMIEPLAGFQVPQADGAVDMPGKGAADVPERGAVHLARQGRQLESSFLFCCVEIPNAQGGVGVGHGKQ